MTDEEFDQMIRDIVVAAEAHPEMKTVAMGPNLLAEFEKRGITLSSLRPYPARVIEGPMTMTDMLNSDG